MKIIKFLLNLFKFLRIFDQRIDGISHYVDRIDEVEDASDGKEKPKKKKPLKSRAMK